MHPQQTGVPFIIMQQVQPAFIMVAMQSQQAWIMSQHLASPLVHVMMQPSAVISHLHMPMVMLQQQTIMPFIIMQQEHIPPASIVQRFCIMLTDILSSLVHIIFIPPVHFSIFTVQRGTIIIFAVVGIEDGMPIVPMPVVPIPARSIIIALVISFGSSEFRSESSRSRPGEARDGTHYAKWLANFKS